MDKPTTEVYDLRADLQIHAFCENLNSESYQPGPFGSTTPSDRANQIAYTIAKESARIKMDSRRQFLKAFDTWELSKKHQNDAVVSKLHTLEQDVTLGIKPAPPGHLFVPWGSPFYAPGLLYCDHGACFCALGSTFCTPTKLNLHLILTFVFIKCSKITNLMNLE